MRVIILIATVLPLAALAACLPEREKRCWVTDQAKRTELFAQCLKLAQVQPQTTHYNDTAEVVNECDDAAYSMSTTLRRGAACE